LCATYGALQCTRGGIGFISDPLGAVLQFQLAIAVDSSQLVNNTKDCNHPLISYQPFIAELLTFASSI
jgi:hypothetical protein